MTTRASMSIAVAASALVGASLLSAGIAHADDPLDPIKKTVNGDRSVTGCPAFAYNSALEAAAQAKVRYKSMPAEGTTAAGYNGKSMVFYGWGDPQAQAINKAYQQGVGDMINNCDYTEFGVGFIRYDDIEDDIVGIAFGAPAKVAPPAAAPAPAPAPVPAPVVTPDPPKVAPKDAVRVSFVKTLPQWTVNVTNASNIAGKCTFTPHGPGGGLSNQSFDIAANGSASFRVSAPPLFVSYHVVTSCHGTFNGEDVEFGHDEQDVSF